MTPAELALNEIDDGKTGRLWPQIKKPRLSLKPDWIGVAGQQGSTTRFSAKWQPVCLKEDVYEATEASNSPVLAAVDVEAARGPAEPFWKSDLG
jgi:hypothetical protein